MGVCFWIFYFFVSRYVRSAFVSRGGRCEKTLRSLREILSEIILIARVFFYNYSTFRIILYKPNHKSRNIFFSVGNCPLISRYGRKEKISRHVRSALISRGVRCEKTLRSLR
jgi:hypothetical protein